MKYQKYFFTLVIVIFNLSISHITCLQSEGIIGGRNATKGQFKSLVIVYRDKVDSCGGAIIGNYYVLTAAHCVVHRDNKFRKDKYSVVGGIIDINEESEDRIQVNVRKIFILKTFRLPIIYDDIAVLELEKSLDLQKNTQLDKLDLPSPYLEYVGRTAEIAGFGWNWVITYDDPVTNETKEIGSDNDSYLRFIQTTILRNQDCSKINGLTKVTSKLMCAKAQQYAGEIEAVCTGDSGGPLIVGNTVVGILSTSPYGCDESKEAALYTRVSKYLDFIDDAKNNKVRVGMRSLEIVDLGHKVVYLETND